MDAGYKVLVVRDVLGYNKNEILRVDIKYCSSAEWVRKGEKQIDD